MYTNQEAFKVKEQLAAATDSVRKKFNALKSGRAEGELALEKLYRPLTKPLNIISEAASSSTNGIKQGSPATIKKEVGKYETKLTPPQTGFEVCDNFEDEDIGSSPCYQLQGNDKRKRSKSTYDDLGQVFETPNTSGYRRHLESRDEEKDISTYLKELSQHDNKYDRRYGVYMNPRTKTHKIGNLDVQFSNGNISLFDGYEKIADYKGTSDLYQLLFYKQPKKATDVNMRAYKEILKITGAPFKGYDKSRGLHNAKSKKLKTIIKPMFSHEGKGFPKIPTHKKVPNGNQPDYVYWNTPKELVSRLRLLWASKTAGHTGHDNEILSIIEELREEHIIY